jgi:hypothetical protein
MHSDIKHDCYQYNWHDYNDRLFTQIEAFVKTVDPKLDLSALDSLNSEDVVDSETGETIPGKFEVSMSYLNDIAQRIVGIQMDLKHAITEQYLPKHKAIQETFGPQESLSFQQRTPYKANELKIEFLEKMITEIETRNYLLAGLNTDFTCLKSEKRAIEQQEREMAIKQRERKIDKNNLEAAKESIHQLKRQLKEKKETYNFLHVESHLFLDYFSLSLSYPLTTHYSTSIFNYAKPAHISFFDANQSDERMDAYIVQEYQSLIIGRFNKITRDLLRNLFV